MVVKYGPESTDTVKGESNMRIIWRSSTDRAGRVQSYAVRERGEGEAAGREHTATTPVPYARDHVAWALRTRAAWDRGGRAVWEAGAARLEKGKVTA